MAIYHVPATLCTRRHSPAARPRGQSHPQTGAGRRKSARSSGRMGGGAACGLLWQRQQRWRATTIPYLGVNERLVVCGIKDVAVRLHKPATTTTAAATMAMTATTMRSTRPCRRLCRRHPVTLCKVGVGGPTARWCGNGGGRRILAATQYQWQVQLKRRQRGSERCNRFF